MNSASTVYAARTVLVCSYCGEVSCDHDADRTPIVLDSSYLAPRENATATTLTTAQIDTVRAFLDGVTARGSELTMHERRLLTSCIDAANTHPEWPVVGGSRDLVAEAFNALQRGA